MAIQMVQQQAIQQRMQQRMILAPQIIQSIEILQLPAMALQERISQELLENPALEVEEVEPDEEGERPDTPADRKAEERVAEGEDFAKLDNLSDVYQDYFWQSASRPAPGDKDEKLEALANTPGPPPTLEDYLFEQIQFLDMDTELRRVMEFLVRNLRPDGYLGAPLEYLAAAMDDPPGEELARDALAALQELDPAGVGARDLRECLLLQLHAMGGGDGLVGALIRDHLEDIRMNRYPKISRDTGAGIEQVKEAVAAIRELDPFPGRAYDTATSPYVTPDVIVEYVDSRYEVSLNDRLVPHLRVSQMYRDIMRDSGEDKDARDYIRQKIDSARWFIDSIHQRRSTLLKVAEEIVSAQQDFFEQGLGRLRPLKMQEVADATGVHVTTVSRAIRRKYAQTPRGVFALKFFFTGGVRTAGGEDESFNAIRRRIVAIVENEDKRRPLSDDQIAATLADQGITIARRTVTKYRKAMDIPSSRQRKEY